MGNKGSLCDLGLSLNDEDSDLQAQEYKYITDWTLSPLTAASPSSAHRAHRVHKHSMLNSYFG